MKDFFRLSLKSILFYNWDTSDGLYEITQLKHEPRDFSLAEIRREIQRGEQIHPFYKIAQRLLPELKISNESIKYYASLVGYCF